jgi:excisionase family DNA binding protein
MTTDNTQQVERLAYRVREFAVALGVSDATIYRLIRTGALVAQKIGAIQLIPASEADRFLTHGITRPVKEADGEGSGQKS